jgi:hypothetical protein
LDGVSSAQVPDRTASAVELPRLDASDEGSPGIRTEGQDRTTGLLLGVTHGHHIGHERPFLPEDIDILDLPRGFLLRCVEQHNPDDPDDACLGVLAAGMECRDWALVRWNTGQTLGTFDSARSAARRFSMFCDVEIVWSPPATERSSRQG